MIHREFSLLQPILALVSCSNHTMGHRTKRHFQELNRHEALKERLRYCVFWSTLLITRHWKRPLTKVLDKSGLDLTRKFVAILPVYEGRHVGNCLLCCPLHVDNKFINPETPTSVLVLTISIQNQEDK